jgi:GNAT superfamily N-acetyltransferase
MPSEPVIDTATAADDAVVAAAINAVRGVDGDAASGFDHDYTAAETRAWRERLEASKGAMLVVRIDGAVAGFGTLEPVSESVASLGVWVSPGHRRKGLGTVLARGVLDLAPERGFRRIRGRMFESEQALSFLGSIGALVPLVNPGMDFELPLE